MSTQQKFEFNAFVAKRAPRIRGRFIKHGYQYGMHDYFRYNEAR